MKFNSFYSGFQINFYDYKVRTLKYILDNFESIDKSYLEGLLDYSDEEFKITLKSEIRVTYFHAIETLFELIFALRPNKNGIIDDEAIVRTITVSGFPYSEISKIAESPTALDFLDNEIQLNDGRLVSLGYYIFYLGVDHDDIKQEAIKSIVNIKKLLQALAKDFSDRREYNSYKHALRIFPAIRELKFLNKETQEQFYSMDFSNSLTFYVENKKTGDFEFITQNLDTERDFRMTSLCSNLIWNIIATRKAFYSKNIDAVDVFFMTEEAFKFASKINVGSIRFNLKISPNLDNL